MKKGINRSPCFQRVKLSMIILLSLSFFLPGFHGYTNPPTSNLTNISVGQVNNRLSDLIPLYTELEVDETEDICFRIECDVDFILDVDGYSFFNCTFQGLEGASVVVEAGNEISCAQSTFTRCDGCLASCGTTDWEGIEVQTGALLSVTATSLIEFADIGINVRPAGTIFVQSTDFLDNRRGINLNGGNITPAFTQNNFECTGRGVICEEGINAINTNFQLGYSASLHQNTFEGLGRGITIDNCNLVSVSNLFEDLTTAIDATNGSTVAVHGSTLNPGLRTIDNCAIGIINRDPLGTVVIGNDIQNVGSGITIDRGIHDRIHNNSINFLQSGISILGNSGQYWITNNRIEEATTSGGIIPNDVGIAILATNNSNQDGNFYGSNPITNNQIEVDGGTCIRISNSEGISAKFNNLTNTRNTLEGFGVLAVNNRSLVIASNQFENTGSVNNTSRGILSSMNPRADYRCNCFDNYSTGIQIAAMNANAMIRTNDFDPNNTSILYSRTGTTGQQFDAQNSFSHLDDSGLGAQHLGNSLNDIFWVPGTPGSSFEWPGPNLSWWDPDAFFREYFTTINTYRCHGCGLNSNAGENFTIPIVVTRLDSLTALIDSLKIPAYEDQMRYIAQRDLYEKLTEHSELLSDSLMDAFYSSHSTTPVGKYYQVAATLQTATEYTHEEKDSLFQYVSELDIIRDSLLAVIKDIVENGSSDSLLNQWDSLMIEMDSLNQLVHVLDSLYTLDRNNALDSLKGPILQLPDSNQIWLENEKYSMYYLAKSILNEIDSTSSGAVDTLEVIAKQCALSGGRGVYLARDILADLRDTIPYFDDDSLCTQLPEPFYVATDDEDSASTIKIFPNPTSGNVMVESGEEKVISEIRIFTAYGKEYQYLRNVDSRKVEVSINNPGVYYFQVVDNKDNNHIRKIIVHN